MNHEHDGKGWSKTEARETEPAQLDPAQAQAVHQVRSYYADPPSQAVLRSSPHLCATETKGEKV